MEHTTPKPALLVVSFGTSFAETRARTIEAVEQTLRKAFPDREFRRAFTSRVIIRILRERDGMEIDTVTEALDRLAAEGCRDVLVQPTHMIPGIEYDRLAKDVAAFSGKFDKLCLGKPLFSSPEDLRAMVDALAEQTAEYLDDDTAFVFMGHGTDHPANKVYDLLQAKFMDRGHLNYFIGTVEAHPDARELAELLHMTAYKKIVLMPLMIVAGDHATNDMAGDSDDSWRSIFEQVGYEVQCILKGISEFAPVREHFILHAREALKKPL